MPNRPQPRFPEPITQPFWEAVKEGKLTYQTCDDCNEVVFYPRKHCTLCGSNNLSWHESEGRGQRLHLQRRAPESDARVRGAGRVLGRVR